MPFVFACNCSKLGRPPLRLENRMAVTLTASAGVAVTVQHS